MVARYRVRYIPKYSYLYHYGWKCIDEPNKEASEVGRLIFKIFNLVKLILRLESSRIDRKLGLDMDACGIQKEYHQLLS